jgi:hypothetical protein
VRIKEEMLTYIMKNLLNHDSWPDRMRCLLLDGYLRIRTCPTRWNSGDTFITVLFDDDISSYTSYSPAHNSQPLDHVPRAYVLNHGDYRYEIFYIHHPGFPDNVVHHILKSLRVMMAKCGIDQ